jgi:hypothetical protein
MFSKTLIALAVGTAFGVSMSAVYAQNATPPDATNADESGVGQVDVQPGIPGNDMGAGQRVMSRDRVDSRGANPNIRSDQSSSVRDHADIRTDKVDIRDDSRHSMRDFDGNDLRGDKRDLRSDTADLRQDKRDIVKDRQDIARDRHDIALDRAHHADSADLRNDYRDLRNDQRDLQADIADAHKDQRDIVKDRQDIARDRALDGDTAALSTDHRDLRSDRHDLRSETASRGGVHDGLKRGDRDVRFTSFDRGDPEGARHHRHMRGDSDDRHHEGLHKGRFERHEGHADRFDHRRGAEDWRYDRDRF